MTPIEPSSPREAAAREVAETIAASGAWPPRCTRTISSSQLWPWAPATASVPKTTFSPGVARARLKTPTMEAAVCRISAKPSFV